jgi:hypothetical protein
MTKDEAFEKFWNTEIVSAVTGSVDTAMWGDIDRNDTAYIFMAGFKACKEALEQPTVTELNDEYLRDTYVQGLSQPAQEPVAWINVKDKLPPVNIEVLTYDKHHEKQYFLTSIIIENVDKFYFNAFTHWMPLPKAPNETNTHPAPSWQGLSDDEIWNIANFLGKNKEWDYPVMFAKTIEKVLREKNNAKIIK